MVIRTLLIMNKSWIYYLIILIFLQHNSLHCQIGARVKMKDHSEINIAAGWHTTLFLDKHSIDDFGRKDLSKHGLGDYLVPNYFQGTFHSKNNFYYSLDYRTYAKSVNPQNMVKGDVLERLYTVIDIGFGKTIYRNKTITLTPTLYVSSRLSGFESVLINYDPSPSSMTITSSFGYRSLGVGSGFSYRQLLYKNINLGLDLIYIHYFQRSVGYPSAPPIEDYVKNYKMNNDALSLCITFGYTINVKSRKSIKTN